MRWQQRRAGALNEERKEEEERETTTYLIIILVFTHATKFLARAMIKALTRDSIERCSAQNAKTR